MIPVSQVSTQARAYIGERLTELATERGVRILFAVESGSRAWGFPSADSDYDVRFVYARTERQYLSVRDYRDVIETPLLEDETLGVPFDLNGWDLRKALRLAINSNPILHEWLVSPILYAGDDALRDDIRWFVNATADPAAYAYHYDRLARGAWEQIGDEDTVKIKRYCYVLRPVLTRLWLRDRDGLPPMDVASLCTGLKLEVAELSAMAQLFALKHAADEQDRLPRQPVLDALIASVLADKPPRPPQTERFDARTVELADGLFHRLITNGV
ncbi:nucleotidyltransferase family protein [Asticcacaulis biprosthecium C19]|uniref:Nucleotidyltransferase family protein n=1 Tax=Asticcacaulis biprosthecium C19 TaxID=715226 RepID=F4QHI0_9CAUL|nr:nucleotidyltransferase domain-containing protein [Asticcacaulis biprosthecium]EGF92717.1 nucleotidyltransferase family protein [Asticcacaulis biprosthecium C19]